MKRFTAILLVLCMMSLAFSVSASSFTPSISQKPAPDVVVEESEGQTVYASTSLNDTDTNIVLDELVVSALDGTQSIANETLTEADIAKLDAAQEKLSAAHDALSDVSVTDVMQSDDFSEDLDYVVSDLFDLTLVGTTAEDVDTVFKDGGTLTVTLALDIPTDADFHLATLCEDEWVVLDKDQVVNNGNGTVTVTFRELCPIAVIRASAPEAQTPMYWLYILLVVVLACAVFIVVKRPKKADSKTHSA